jgi:hypothetical protein
MLQRSTHILATLASLSALLIGLAGGWEFWSVVRRATVSYVGVYLLCGILLLLGHFALRSAPVTRRDSIGNDAESGETDGTDAAR